MDTRRDIFIDAIMDMSMDIFLCMSIDISMGPQGLLIGWGRQPPGTQVYTLLVGGQAELSAYLKVCDHAFSPRKSWKPHNPKSAHTLLSTSVDLSFFLLLRLFRIGLLDCAQI